MYKAPVVSDKQGIIRKTECKDPQNHTPLPRLHWVDIEIYWLFCSNDGKLDQSEKSECKMDEEKAECLSIAWSQISMHTRSLL